MDQNRYSSFYLCTFLSMFSFHSRNLESVELLQLIAGLIFYCLRHRRTTRVLKIYTSEQLLQQWLRCKTLSLDRRQDHAIYLLRLLRFPVKCQQNATAHVV